MCGHGGQSTDAGGYGLGMLRAADGLRRAAPHGGMGLRSIEQARDLGVGVHGVAREGIAASRAAALSLRPVVARRASSIFLRRVPLARPLGRKHSANRPKRDQNYPK